MFINVNEHIEQIDEIQERWINIYYISEVYSSNHKNPDSYSIIEMRTGHKKIIAEPVYTLKPRIDKEYRDSIVKLMAFVIADSVPEQSKKPRTRKKP